MNIFKLMKRVLDEEYAAIPGPNAAKDALVRSKLQALRSSYRTLAKRPPSTDYSDPATRLAYVFAYVTCHTILVEDSLDQSKALSKACDADALTVSCVGGGPGSDFLGLLRYLSKAGWTGKLMTYLLDAEAGWGDAWSDISAKMDDVGGLDFGVNTHFQQLDATNSKTWLSQRKYLQSDIFTFVYFISEVHALGAAVEPFFDHLFSNAKSGALFLLVENDSETFVDWFDKIAARSGLQLVEERTDDARLPGDEQKSDLAPYPTNFSSQPKLTAKMVARVYRKP